MLTKFPRLPETWLGSADSYLRVAEAVRHAMLHPDNLKSLMYSDDAASEEEKDTRSPEERYLDAASNALIQIKGRVGMVNINGPLVTENSWWNELFGLVSYDSVSLALQKVMLEEPQVEYALMVLDTGGGDASGVENISNNIKELQSASDVSLLTHVQGAALSAGYWIGAHGSPIYGNRMAQAGSIGVILTHRSHAEALKQRGVKDTVITSGSEKSLGHPSLPLSDKDKKLLQKQSDTLYEFFTDHVAAERHLSTSELKTWADGKTFFMEESVEVGLADFVMPLQELLADLNDGFEEEETLTPGGAESLDSVRRGEPVAA